MSGKKNPTQDELNAAAEKAEADSSTAAAKAADPKASQADKDAAAKAAADAAAARSAADAGPIVGTITVSLTGSFAPFKDSTKEFNHTTSTTASGTVAAAVAYLNGIEAANAAAAKQNELDKREVAEAEARDARIANVKAGKPATAPDSNAGKDSRPTT